MATPLDSAWELMTRGDLAAAERTCRQVLSASNNQNAAAWTMLGLVLRKQNRPRDAEGAYRRALALDQRDVYAHHNLGALLSAEDRPEEALIELEKAQGLGLKASELHVNLGRTLLQLYRLDDAESAYSAAVTVQPDDATAHSMLAQLRFMRSDPAYARDLISAAAANPTHAALQLTLADTQWRAGDLEGVARTLRELYGRTGPFPELSSALARFHLEQGRARDAWLYAVDALAASPADVGIADTTVRAGLAAGLLDEASAIVTARRTAFPDDQRWIAYEATIARMRGHALHRELYDYARFVRTYDIAVPDGYASLEEFNLTLATALRARHLFKSHPLDQSLRHGSQTARNLMTDAEPVIQALLKAFEAPLADYVDKIEAKEGHPLSARGRGRAVLRGCWSVELQPNGFHINHVHPQGWISSAYYVQVPGNVSDTTLKPGWIKFGEPGVPMVALGPEHFVQPRPGRLVLFPSYMWHGTNPFIDDETRLSVAFDAVAPRL